MIIIFTDTTTYTSRKVTISFINKRKFYMCSVVRKERNLRTVLLVSHLPQRVKSDPIMRQLRRYVL